MNRYKCILCGQEGWTTGDITKFCLTHQVEVQNMATDWILKNFPRVATSDPQPTEASSWRDRPPLF